MAVRYSVKLLTSENPIAADGRRAAEIVNSVATAEKRKKAGDFITMREKRDRKAAQYSCSHIRRANEQNLTEAFPMPVS